MKTLLVLILSLSVVFFAAAQKSVSALRNEGVITLDGNLSEEIWSKAEVADSFIVNFPTVGNLSKFESKVMFVYDDEAIYIGAILNDPHPDSLMSPLSQRDDYGNADWFGILIDPYGAGQNGFSFFVTAAGVEIDAIRSQNDADFTWNAVWKSKVKLTETGWIVEMKVPLTQLRFTKEEIQHWKINYKRQIRRNREVAYWAPVDPQVYGELAQSGELTNLTNLSSPLRLSFSPYGTTYLENYYNDQTGAQEWALRPRFGMDMKLGLSEAFTLDATLVPDFGQTVSDNLVLNLSPFEVRYNENRPFFLEGMDLFGIGDIFYSRRIGDNTLNGYRADSLQEAGNKITSAPNLAQLVNATKISGRTKSGLGIGVFNAIEKQTNIEYEDSLGNKHEILSHPTSNYNVFVLSQNLKNNNSISFINSNVFRPEINALSNVSSAEFQVLTKNRMYALFGQGQFSYNQRNGQTDNGYTNYLNFSKVEGARTFGGEYYECSNTYDPNELGFLSNNNYRGANVFYKGADYDPGGHLLRRNVNFSTSVNYLYKPSLYSNWEIFGEWIGTFRNFLTSGFYAGANPIGTVDHFESRTMGIPMNVVASAYAGGFYSSNYSKRVALDISLSARKFAETKKINAEGSISPRFRISNKLFIVPEVALTYLQRDYGYVYVSDPVYENDIILGTRDRWIVNNNITGNYTFTNRIGMILKVNHYWQEVTYVRFNKLENNGRREETAYTGYDSEGVSNHNTSFNAFTLDMDFRWVIYPGSEIRFVWKYNIYASKAGNYGSYFNVFNDLFDQPRLNSFSIKALFYLNAGKLMKRK